MEQSKEYSHAKKRVEAKMGFYTHFAVFVAVVLFLAIINFFASPGTMWVHWPFLGWGAAVALHFVFAFLFPGRFAVTEDMIRKELSKS